MTDKLVSIETSGQVTVVLFAIHSKSNIDRIH
jgi:hypothetical protein